MDLRRSSTRPSWLLAWVLSSCSGSAMLNAGSGGAPNNPLVQDSGGAGNSADASVDAYCDGILSGHYSCPYFTLDSTTVPLSCDITLNFSSTTVVAAVVVLDCKPLNPAQADAGDAGSTEGYLLDYADTPVQLILLGASCNAATTPGYHRIDVITGCGGPV